MPIKSKYISKESVIHFFCAKDHFFSLRVRKIMVVNRRMWLTAIGYVHKLILKLKHKLSLVYFRVRKLWIGSLVIMVVEDF